MFFKKSAEILKQFWFFSAEGGKPQVPSAIFKIKVSYRNAYDFAEFGPDPGTVVKLFGSVFFLSLIKGFLFPKKLFVSSEVIKRLFFGHRFDIQEKDIFKIQVLQHRLASCKIHQYT